MGLFMEDTLLELFVYSILGQIYEKFLYTSIWLNSERALKLIRQAFGSSMDPCEAVHVGLISAKTIQAMPMICAFNYFGSLPEVSLFNFVLVLMAAMGQYLNFSVYDAIGKDGVYYGIKFGRNVPWSTKFPYNYAWLKHPQYLGAYIFICSTVLLAYPKVGFLYKGGYMFVTGCIYVFISYVEQCL